MRAKIALTGVAALCVLLSLPACRSNGDELPDSPNVVIETQLVEVPRRQLVKVSSTLTEADPLPPAPTPEVKQGPSCTRALGCYSNRQLETMLGWALAGRQQAVDNLAAIRRLMIEALNTTGENTDAPDPAPVP